MKKSLLVILTILICLAVIQTCAIAEDVKADQVVIVCHKSFPLVDIDKVKVEEFFLGKTTLVGEKKDKVKVSVLKEGPVHKSFVKNYIKKTTSQFKNFWKKLVFSGKAKMPKTFKTEKELVEYVAKTEGAIGYIHIKTSKDSTIVTDSVKVIPVTVR